MIIIEPCAGLGNRLLSLASAYHWAKRNNEELTVLWKKEEALGARFGDIFMPVEGVRCIELKDYSFKSHPFSQLRYDLCRKKYAAGADFFSDTENTMDTYKEKGMEGFAGIMEKYGVKFIRAFSEFYDLDSLKAPFGFITPSKAVLSRVEQTVPDGKDGDIIGIHIRRADHRICIENSPLELFVDKMKLEAEQNDGVKFYVASDDEPTIKQLVKMFGGRVLYMKEKDFSRESVRGIVDAYAELLCLSRSRKIIGSFYSSYSRMAAMLSGIPLEIMQEGEIKGL